MNARVLPIGPAAAAMFVDKPLATARAQCALLGQQLHVVDDDELGIAYQVGTARFATLEEVEAWLDERGAPA